MKDPASSDHTSQRKCRTGKYADIRPLSMFLTLYGHFIKQTVGVNLVDAAVNSGPLGKVSGLELGQQFSRENRLMTNSFACHLSSVSGEQ